MSRLGTVFLFLLLATGCGGTTTEEEASTEETPQETTVETTMIVEETVFRTVQEEARAGAEEDEDDSAGSAVAAAPVVAEEEEGNSGGNGAGGAAAPHPAVAEEEQESDNGRISVAVASVTDGDTIKIAKPVEGLTDVRLIGIDTPETYGGIEPYGPEASAFATQVLSGQTVTLELDEEVSDQYGRLLAYVYLPDGTMFNETLAREGYAQVATFPPNVRYEADFLAAQSAAQLAGLGIWSLPPDQQCQLADRGNGIGGGCEAAPQPVTPAPVEPAPVEPAPVVSEETPAAPSGGATDGYYPGAPDLDCSDFSSAVTVSPGDPFRLDADGDGIGCDS